MVDDAARHVVICQVCGTFQKLRTLEQLSAVCREHRRDDSPKTGGHFGSITVLFDSSDETDAWLEAIMKWRTQHSERSQD